VRHRLSFGARARRRRKIRRLVSWTWIFCMVGMIAGIPGTDLSLDLVNRVFGRKVAAQSAGAFDTTEAAAGMKRFQRGLFRKRPTPSPTFSPSPSMAGSPAPIEGTVEDVIFEAAAEFGLSGTYLVSVAECESHLNPHAYNPAGYYGLFQFDDQTWSAYGYGSVYDPVAQARTAARLIAAGQSSRWPNCA
jgi:soluble lytic murein transglycosylase-like protein